MSENTWAAFIIGIGATCILMICLFAAYDFGKYRMREEIKRYGVEQALKFYEVQP